MVRLNLAAVPDDGDRVDDRQHREDAIGTSGRHRAPRAARRRALVLAWVVGTAGIGVLSAGVTSASSSRPTAVAPAPLGATGTPPGDALHPGTAVTGVVRITSGTTRQVEQVSFGAVTSDGCAATGVALAPTSLPTPEFPLEVPAGGTAGVEYAAYMDGEGEHACQGTVLTSAVLLDGEPAGSVTVLAGTLTQPPAPVGGQTTSTRAAVRWSPSTAAHPGWVVERARAGTDDWQPACDSSPARPVRALSCTDTGLAASTSYAYRVTLRTGHWRATSRRSAPVLTQDRPST